MIARNMCHRFLVTALVSAILTASLGIVAIAQDKTIILGQEDAATGDLGQDLKTAATLIKDGYNAGQLSTDKFIYYGNWYGPGLSGGDRNTGKPGNSQPIDELDAIAMRHDFAYDIAAEMGKKYGPQEEARLRALADSIAVREANALPRNPREWDPPAPNPEEAREYRRRIGFGFKHTSVIAGAASKAMGTYQAIRDTIKNKELTLPASSGITEADLQRQSAERAKGWFTGENVRQLYRLELSAQGDLVEEGGHADIHVQLVPILNEGYQGSIIGRDEQGREQTVAPSDLPTISFSVDGPGSLMKNFGDIWTVRLTPKKKWFGLASSVGSTIKVTGSYEGKDIDVVPASLTFVVARRTQLKVEASPTEVAFGFPSEEADPCREVEIRASLVTSSGDPVEGMPLTFARDDGTTATATTDENGVATMTADVCREQLDGELSNTVPFIVTTASSQVGDQIFITSSETVTVRLMGTETAIVRGRVVDKGRNDRPIEGAAVVLSDPFGLTHEATTGGDGSFSIHVGAQESGLPEISGTVTATGYQAASFAATTAGKTYTVGLYPQEATLIGHIVTQTEEGGTVGIDGSTVHISSPFDQLLTTSGGDFTVSGLFVGDTVTMRADAHNFRAYVKSGKITMENPVVTFVLTPGSGEESNVLEEEEATEEEKSQTADLGTLYSLMVWASPADPATFQSVTITAQIFPPTAGVSIEIRMHGTDDYASSITGMTNAMGKVLLPIPGAASGVVDDIVARIVGTNVRQRLRYSF